MASEYDPAEFVDNDFRATRQPGTMAATAHAPVTEVSRAPSREEVEARVTDMQSKLGELRRVQQELERERTDLEETRRRQVEFAKGRQEMEQNLTRGVGLLEEAEFAARRDAEQMAKALADLRDALMKVQAAREESWTKENLNIELTRALTTVENARMEWNSARLKFPLLSGDSARPEAAPAPADGAPVSPFAERTYPELFKMGLALTWPLASVGLGILVVLLLKR